MKKFRLSILAMAILLVFASCTKHKLIFDTTPVPDDWAEFQLHYFEPVLNNASNYIDSVYVNDVLYSSSRGTGVLIPMNGVPSQAVGRFFGVKAGSVNLKLYRKDELIYDKNMTLTPGKQDVWVVRMDMEPFVTDNGYPYWSKTPPATSVGWSSDSVANVMFVNMLFEDNTGHPVTPATPYPGKLKFQYQDNKTKEWVDVGDYVSFGETSGRQVVRVRKQDGVITSGYESILFRILTESGDVLQYRSGAAVTAYTPWQYARTLYIGRAYVYIISGVRTGRAPSTSLAPWTSL
jgi:hypothetical protein